VFISSRVPVTSCRPNELWEFVSIRKTCLPIGSLGTFGCGISWSQVPGTLVVCRFLSLEEFNHPFAAHAIVRVERNRFICWTDNRVFHWWTDARSRHPNYLLPTTMGVVIAKDPVSYPAQFLVYCPGGSTSVGPSAMPSPDPSSGTSASPSVVLRGSPSVESSSNPSLFPSTRRRASPSSGPISSPSAGPSLGPSTVE
jgi:hypothetical protein